MVFVGDWRGGGTDAPCAWCAVGAAGEGKENGCNHFAPLVTGDCCYCKKEFCLEHRLAESREPPLPTLSGSRGRVCLPSFRPVGRQHVVSSAFFCCIAGIGIPI